MKDKERGRSISLEEEKIKTLLRSDIDGAARTVGRWKEISEEAYEPRDHVKRSSIPLMFAAACAVMVAAAMGIMMLFTDDYYKIDAAPKAAPEDENSAYAAEIVAPDSSLTDEQFDGYAVSNRSEYLYSEDAPLIGEIQADYSVDENGDPSSGSYRLKFDVMFPHEEGYTDYGGLYVYAICEGEVLYAPEYPIRYEADTIQSVSSVIFDMKSVTAEKSPKVTVLAFFVRDGGIKEISGCSVYGNIYLTNPNYSDQTADKAYTNGSDGLDISESGGSAVGPSLALTENAESGELGIVFESGMDNSSDDCDLILISTEGACVSKYLNCTVDNTVFSSVDGGYKAFAPLSLMFGESGESGGYAAAAVIARDGSSITVSPIYDLDSYYD